MITNLDANCVPKDCGPVCVVPDRPVIDEVHALVACSDRIAPALDQLEKRLACLAGPSPKTCVVMEEEPGLAAGTCELACRVYDVRCRLQSYEKRILDLERGIQV